VRRSQLALLSALICLATAICRANYPDQISVLLDVGATTLTVHNTGAGGSDVGLSFSPGVNQRVRFSLMRVYVPPPAGSTYTACANPCTVSLNRNWGQQYEFIEYVDNSGNPLSAPKKSAVAPAYSAGCSVGAVLPQVELPVITTSPLPMPIEVIGQDCYTTHVRLPLVNGHASTGLRLFARIHAPMYNSTLKFDGKVSVQVNSGAWLTYSNSNNSLAAVDEMRWYSLGTTFQGAGTPIPLFAS
jgi:hypothetical protein